VYVPGSLSGRRRAFAVRFALIAPYDEDLDPAQGGLEKALYRTA